MNPHSEGQMSNAFSKDYKPQTKTSDLAGIASLRAAATNRRAERMASGDPAVQAQARGDMGPLSGNCTNVRIQKPSGLG